MPLSPPRDASGEIVPHDDEAIGGVTVLVRHVNPEYHVTDDENSTPPRRRIASNLFSSTNGDPHHGMSVDIGQLLTEAGKPLDEMVEAPFGAISFTVADTRSFGLQVGSHPMPGNDFHGQAWGVNSTKKKKLARDLSYSWVVEIPGVDLR